MSGPLDRSTLEAAFGEIGARAVAEGKLVEISVYGGAALVLTHDARQATRDVDAVFQSHSAWLRRIAADIAGTHGWSESWLNDGVKGFLSDKDRASDAQRLFRSYPSEDRPGLRVFLATPTYLFAMKCLAMRIGGVDVTQDRTDIEMLARELNIETAAAALQLVGRFYPSSRISAKTQFGIEEIFGAGASDGEI